MVSRASAVGCHPLREVPSLRRRGSTSPRSWPGLSVTAAVQAKAPLAAAAGACLADHGEMILTDSSRAVFVPKVSVGKFLAAEGPGFLGPLRRLPVELQPSPRARLRLSENASPRKTAANTTKTTPIPESSRMKSTIAIMRNKTPARALPSACLDTPATVPAPCIVIFSAELVEAYVLAAAPPEAAGVTPEPRFRSSLATVRYEWTCRFTRGASTTARPGVPPIGCGPSFRPSGARQSSDA